MWMGRPPPSEVGRWEQGHHVRVAMQTKMPGHVWAMFSQGREVQSAEIEPVVDWPKKRAKRVGNMTRSIEAYITQPCVQSRWRLPTRTGMQILRIGSQGFVSADYSASERARKPTKSRKRSCRIPAVIWKTRVTTSECQRGDMTWCDITLLALG